MSGFAIFRTPTKRRNTSSARGSFGPSVTTPRGPIIEDVTNEATDPGTDRPGGEVPENPGTPVVRPSENPPVEDNPGGGVEESKIDQPSASSTLTASAERVRQCAW